MFKRRRASEPKQTPEDIGIQLVEAQTKLAERRKQLLYSTLFLALFALTTFYNLKARILALAIITGILLVIEVLRMMSIRRAILQLEHEIRILEISAPKS